MGARRCGFCGIPMDEGSCKPTAVVEGIEYHRVPYEPDYGDAEQRCHDCTVGRGQFHHAGCDMERCPRCLQQAIACGCKWADDEPENEEHPDARRVAGQARDGAEGDG